MAATKYSYVISTDTANGLVDSPALTKEIGDSSIVTALSHIDTNSDILDIWFKDALIAGDQTLLTVVVASHTGEKLEPPPQTVIVKEEVSGVTGGNYAIKTATMTVDHAIGTTKDLDISFPYPVSVFSAQFVCKAHHEGDIIDVIMAPDTTIGAITSDVASGATILPVQDSVLDNIRLGFMVSLDNGTTQNDLGECTGIDRIAKTITVSTATSSSFLAATPTYVKMTVNLVRNFTLPHAYKIDIGRDVIGGSLLPGGTIMRIKYKNNEGTTVGKTFTFMMEYKY